MKQKRNNELKGDVEHFKKQLIWWRDWTNRDYLIVGLCLGILLACGFWMLALGLTYENIAVQTGDDKVVLIGKAWEGCWLAVGEEDVQLYWKCDRFSAPIGVFVCSEEIAKEQLKRENYNTKVDVFREGTCILWEVTDDVQRPFKVEYLENGYVIGLGKNGWILFVEGYGSWDWNCLQWDSEKLWWQRDCLDRKIEGVIQEKEECKNCEEWSDLILKEYPSYAYNLPGDVNLQVFKGEIKFGTPSENCKEIDNSVSCRIEYETLDGNIFSFNYNFRSLEYSKPMLLYDKYCLEVEE